MTRSKVNHVPGTGSKFEQFILTMRQMSPKPETIRIIRLDMLGESLVLERSFDSPIDILTRALTLDATTANGVVKYRIEALGAERARLGTITISAQGSGDTVESGAGGMTMHYARMTANILDRGMAMGNDAFEQMKKAAKAFRRENKELRLERDEAVNARHKLEMMLQDRYSPKEAALAQLYGDLGETAKGIPSLIANVFAQSRKETEREKKVKQSAKDNPELFINLRRAAGSLSNDTIAVMLLLLKDNMKFATMLMAACQPDELELLKVALRDIFDISVSSDKDSPTGEKEEKS